MKKLFTTCAVALFGLASPAEAHQSPATFSCLESSEINVNVTADFTNPALPKDKGFVFVGKHPVKGLALTASTPEAHIFSDTTNGGTLMQCVYGFEGMPNASLTISKSLGKNYDKSRCKKNTDGYSVTCH